MHTPSGEGPSPQRADQSTGAGDDLAGTPPLLERAGEWGERVTIRFNRPHKANRIEPVDLETLARHLDTVAGERGVRVVVLTGTGRIFSAGYHLGDLGDRYEGGTAAGEGLEFSEVADLLENLPQPTVCALNGGVYGGATDLALACDFRVGVEGIALRMPAARLGVHYYRSGMQRYVTRLGLGAAKRLFLLAQTVDDETMLRLGFLDELVPAELFEATVDGIAGALAGNAPLSVRYMKRALNQIARGAVDEAAFEEGYRACHDSRDLGEGIAAWREKREPRFEGR